MLASLLVAVAVQTTIFEDNFEGSLAKWDLTQPDFVAIVNSGDPARGGVLLLDIGGPENYAIIKGSEAWGTVRMTGMVMFPEDVHNYLGFIWGYRPGEGRTDFGSAYIKGNGSYIRVNPRYDGNPGRAYNEEYRTPLEGESAVVIGRWQRFGIEVSGTIAHLYFGDMTQPKVTYRYVGKPGALGLKPRVVGGAVLVDDIVVERLDRLTYQGPPIPDIAYDPDPPILTDWQVLGPTIGLHVDLERSPQPTTMTVREGGRELGWRPFETDERGAVVTARVVEFRGERTRAYFATEVEVDTPGEYIITLSTVDDLAIWIDGQAQGYLDRSRFAWYDFLENPDHEGAHWGIELDAGSHSILIGVRGALYASGAFFMAVQPAG